MDSVHGLAIRGRRQGPTMTQGSSRGISIGQDERPECPHRHKNHYSTCRRVTGGCFRCGSINHFIVNYPRGSRSLEILKEVAEEDQMYLHQLVIEVEGEVVQDSKEKVLLQRQ